MNIRQLYKKWTGGETENPFTKDEQWRGDMVKGFVSFCINETLNSEPPGSTHNKDLEVSAPPTPKVCPVCKSENLKLMLIDGFRCLDCNSQGHLGKPSLNPNN